MENTELIRVTQLPIIEERLRTMKAAIEAEVSKALSLVCTDETVQSVKKVRADLNKQFTELEEQRKLVKNTVLAPYEQFEAVYKECVTNVFKPADNALKGKIADVENTMKGDCEAAAREFFAEACAAHGLDFVTFEQTGVCVSMADAKAKQQPPKRICDQITEFVNLVAYDMQTIANMEMADEIAVEYKRTLHVGQALSTVLDRHKRISEEQILREQRATEEAKQAEAVQRVEAFAAPTAAPVEEPKLMRLTFTVTDTLDRLKALKRYMLANGYQVE